MIKKMLDKEGCKMEIEYRQAKDFTTVEKLPAHSRDYYYKDGHET